MPIQLDEKIGQLETACNKIKAINVHLVAKKEVIGGLVENLHIFKVNMGKNGGERSIKD